MLVIEEVKNHIYFKKKTKNKLQKIGSKFIAGTPSIGYNSTIYNIILKYEHDNRPIDDIIGEEIK